MALETAPAAKPAAPAGAEILVLVAHPELEQSRANRRPRGLVPARQLQPLLLRRLPAALRADGGALRHALPAAAPPARRAQGGRGRARRTRRALRRPARELSALARDRGGAGMRAVRGAADGAADRQRDGARLMEH